MILGAGLDSFAYRSELAGRVAVFDIGNSYVEQVAPAAAERGEPWLSFFSPRQMTALLSGHGFAGASHIATRDVGSEAMWRRTDALRPADLSRLAHARLSA